MTPRSEHIWVYLGEVIASALLLVALDRLIGVAALSVWLGRSQPALGNLLIVAAAASAVTLGAFFAVLTTDFGLALRRKGAAKSYVAALALPLILFVCTLGLLTLGNSAWGTSYIELTMFLLLYSSLNLLTMVKNVIDIAGLWQDVDRAKRDGRRN